MNKEIKVLAITFHRAENYGSMLQAFALQEFIKEIDNSVEYKILDYAPEVQRNVYRIIPRINNIKSAAKALVALKNYKELSQKKKRFADFVKGYLDCTTTVDSSPNALQSVIKGFDVCIFGSDQIWNTNGQDFDWIYMGENISISKKISYAASMGSGYFIDGWKQEHREKAKQLLDDFTALSVREIGAKEAVTKIASNSLRVLQNIDPVFLLTKEEWLSKLNIKSESGKRYILFYSLNPDTMVMNIVKELGRKIGMPVIVTKFNNMHDIVNPFDKKYNTGPIEFLELLYNAELVLSTSFHGVAFSILFNKPFYAINPYSDSRLESILEFCDLQDRAIRGLVDIERAMEGWSEIDYCSANQAIEKERERSKAYLSSCLEIG